MTADSTSPMNVSRAMEHDLWARRLWDRPFLELSPCQMAVVIRAAAGGFPAAVAPAPELPAAGPATSNGGGSGTRPQRPASPLRSDRQALQLITGPLLLH